MSLQTDRGYNFEVTSGNLIQSQAKGTPGFQVGLGCDDGETSFTIWLTHKNKEGAIESFKALGINVADLASRSFIENQLPSVVIGKIVHGFMRSEEYPIGSGKWSLKCASISPKREVSIGGLAAVAAGFFDDDQVDPELGF